MSRRMLTSGEMLRTYMDRKTQLINAGISPSALRVAAQFRCCAGWRQALLAAASDIESQEGNETK